MSRETEEHPSYGIVRVSRVTGGKSHLFMSNVPHPHRISLKVVKAVKERSLSDDRAYPREEIVEVHMSEAQFARMLSSIGMGEGVPCTISRLNGKIQPDCPAEDHAETFEREIEGKARAIDKKLSELLSVANEKLMEDSGYMNSEDREALFRKIRNVKTEYSSNLPFIIDQLKEKMDDTIHEAKTNIEAFVGRAQDAISGALALPEGFEPRGDGKYSEQFEAFKDQLQISSEEGE